MNWIDIFTIVCMLVLAAVGIWRGFLKGLIRLLAWAAAIAGAYFAQDLLAETISTNLNISGFAVKLVCICIGFIVPFLTLFFIGHFVRKSIESTALGKADRILGGILGLCKGWLISFILLTILHILPVTGSLKDARNEALAYSFYKFNIELLGFSSEEVDIVGMAEKKASELSKEITDKAVEKVKESTAQAAEQAKDAAIKAAKDAVAENADKLKEKVSDAAKAVTDTAKAGTETAKDKAGDVVKDGAAVSEDLKAKVDNFAK